ncbi:BppU family phage baseplate upper protein [Clostridium disporicum]|uniref:Choline binding protein n=1 Tax=Clostridium disporicum TaxID=84024 RepID=A0A174D4S5_9CLOT|nr:BppU family phage baseplate upper protein [Clostridium disporicum]CUO20534.1 choline binding protein [Clostridium disporicum]
MNTKTIKFDLNKYKLYEKIKAKQGDTKSRFLLFQLLDGSIPFNLKNRSVRAYMIKPDGREIFNDLIVNNYNLGYCTLELTNQVLAAQGIVKIELMVTEGDKKLTSSVFELEVVKSINSEKSIVSTNEFTALLNGLAALSEYDNYKNSVKEMEINKANKAEVEEKFISVEEKIKNNSEQLDNIETLKADKENITELINVLSLGFDNTGNDDITEKLQNIFDTKNNITLYFPSGQYRINGNLTVGDNKNFKLIGENYRTVKFNCYANDGKVFNMSASSLTNEIHVTFEHISFINSGMSQTLTCLYYYLCSGDVITKNCFLNKFYNNIELYKTFTFQLYKTISINAINSCLSIKACNQFIILDGQYTGAKKYNIYLYYNMCFQINCDYSAYGKETTNGLYCSACLGGNISGYYEGETKDSGILIDGSQAISITNINISYFAENTTIIKIVDSKATKISCVAFNQYDAPIVNATAILCGTNAFETLIENCYFNHIGTCIQLSDSTRTRIKDCNALPSKITKFINAFDSDGCIFDVSCVSNLFEKSTIPTLGTKKIDLTNIKKVGATASRPQGYFKGQEYLDLERKKKMFWDGSKWWYFDGTEVG